MRNKLVLLILCAVLMIEGCNNTESIDSNLKKRKTTYKTLYSTEVTTLNYLTTGSQHEQQIGANVIDTLLEYDKYGDLKPALAEYFIKSDDGLTWTFYLRRDVKWVDYKGREVAKVTANDFVDAARYVLTAKHGSATAQSYFGMIRGANEYYDGVITDFSKVGVKAVDDFTLRYTLKRPIPYFLSTLTYVCFMPAYGPLLKKYGQSFAIDHKKMYYNGAYVLSDFDPQVKREYTKNKSYWDAKHVYLTKIEERYNSEAATLGPVLVQRGEIDQARIGSDLLDDWLNAKNTKNLVSKKRENTGYSYFYCFNFNPKFDKKYEPENWMLAVNNENFRKAIMYALDRVRVISVTDPYEPDAIVSNTITPYGFIHMNGYDYTSMGDLKEIANTDTYNPKKALQYKEQALKELKQVGAHLPIKILMPYNTRITNWDRECLVVKQQMEDLLGKDFINIIVEAGPANSFLSKVRRSGKYALMKCGWGADYADPQTFTAPFYEDYKYSFFDSVLQDNTETTPMIKEYYELVGSAISEYKDLERRYLAFSKAESYLIKHALVVPFSISGNEYQVTRLNVFEGEYAPFGISTMKYKGQHLLDKPISMSDYNMFYEKWEQERKGN